MWFRPWLGLKRWHYAEHVALYFSHGSACQSTASPLAGVHSQKELKGVLTQSFVPAALELWKEQPV